MRHYPSRKPRTAAGWPARDTAAHNRFARAVKKRDGYACRRCGATEDLKAHHVRPGYDVGAGITVCGACHRAIDPHAR
jgi:hypothetical protein